jgi:nucleotide-binding universal stress UspA family protein
MGISLFHIYRNTPLGRENLLQSVYLCDRLGDTTLHVYSPSVTQAVVYFDDGPVTITLDGSYLYKKETAREEVERVCVAGGIRYAHFEPESFTARMLADIPADWSLIACPRVISDSSSRIGLGRLGPKVRAIVKASKCPVFIPCGAYKPWKSVTAFFGGSDVGLRAAQLGSDLAHRTGMSLTVVTQVMDPGHGDRCERVLAEAGLSKRIYGTEGWSWLRFDTGTLEEHLMRVPHDSLVVVGAAGDSLIHELVFGSKLELIQSTLPNPIMVVGPNCDRRLLW